MCKLLGVKRGNYYKWLKHKDDEPSFDWNHLIELVKTYDEKYDHILGYRSMRDRIERDTGESYTDSRIYKVMNYLGLQSKTRQKGHSCTKRAKDAKQAPNKLKRDFNASSPNQKWVTDVSEMKYGLNFEHKLYISAILDLYDRTVVGYVLGDSNNNPLVFETFDRALEANPGAKPLFHSDAGFQYTSPAFINKLKNAGMEQSMSRIGKCIDNGPMEGFWGILKSEMYYGKHYKTREELVEAIDSWIYYYTFIRLQRRFDVQTPYEVRNAAMVALMNNEEPVEYKIPENKRIEAYKKEHYSRYQDNQCA